MAKLRAPYLYTETRLNLDQAYANSTIDITLSKTGNHDRHFYNDVTIGGDESRFKKEHLSSEASIHFRSDERCPRSFLWRLLDDRKALEIQAVDLSQDQKQKNEAILTLLLRFPAAIRPFCIAFADPAERDALNVFAITTQDELWTLTLHRDLFVHTKNTEILSSDWCRVSKPSILSVTSAFRLFATTARELFVSAKDGQIIRLSRSAGQDGSKWHDVVYAEGHWGASLLKWRSGPTIKFGDLDLQPTAPVAIASTSFDEDDAHLITVCLNHTLRIWNLKTGRISAEMDLLGEEDQKYLIAANQKQLLQLMDMPGRQEQYVVTYSPKHHQFKFWAIHDAEAGRQGIREMRPELEYKPPIEILMDTAVWNLEEFHVRPSRGTKQTELWIRVRSGQTSQVFMLSFDPFDFGHKLYEVNSQYVKACWEQDWVAVHQGRQTLEALDQISPMSLEALSPTAQTAEITEKWMQYLFYPGRFTVPLLETALETFLVASGKTLPSTSKEPLKDRLVKAVWSSAARPTGGRRHSVDQAASLRWQNFYSIVRDLYKKSSDAVSFAMDPHEQIPWVVTADSVAPIRECSSLEKIEANAAIVNSLPTPKLALYSFEGVQDDDRSVAIEEEQSEALVGNLFYMAHTLRSLLPPTFQSAFKRLITQDLISEPAKSISDRIHAIQSQSALFEELSEEDNARFDEVVTEFGGYQAFHTQNFTDLLKTLTEPEKGRHQEELVTRYGSKLAIRIAQETVALNTDVLLDLLATVLYLEGSFEMEELAAAINGLPEDAVDAMAVDQASPAFDAHALFDKIMALLRENILLDFLTSNIRKERTKARRRSSISGDSPASTRVTEPVYASTLLQSIFIGDWKDVRAPEEDMPTTQLLTYHTRAWLTKLEVNQYESFSAHVFSDLVKHGDTSLAEQFLPFVPVTGWSSYLRGRLYLEKGDYNKATEWFKKCAYAMSLGFFDVQNHDTAELLLPDQVEKFLDGLPVYYEHIMSLLDKHRASLQTSEFAKLALQAHHMDMSKAEKDAQDRGKPMGKKESEALKKRNVDLLERLFTSSLATANFDDAYSALIRMEDHPLRHFDVQSFIQTLVSANRVKQLFAYPWAQLADSVDKELESKAKKTLNSNTKPEYHKILYSWRIKRGNYRGAAQAAFDRLERLRQDSKSSGPDPRDERVVEAYLLLINAMACIGQNEAWVLYEPIAQKNGLINGTKGEKREGKRRLVTLEDVRREYQEELDRRAALEQGRFGFVDEGNEMDVL